MVLFRNSHNQTTRQFSSVILLQDGQYFNGSPIERTMPLVSKHMHIFLTTHIFILADVCVCVRSKRFSGRNFPGKLTLCRRTQICRIIMFPSKDICAGSVHSVLSPHSFRLLISYQIRVSVRFYSKTIKSSG